MVQKKQQKWALLQHVVWDLCSCVLQMFSPHSASPLSQLPCMTALLWGFGGGRSERQNRSDIKQRAAPSCAALEGSLDVLLNMKGLMAERQNGSTGPCARGRQDGHRLHIHIYVHTQTQERRRHIETQSLGQGQQKKAQTKSNAHTAETIIMPSEIA